jgi:hypothetical protein
LPNCGSSVDALEFDLGLRLGAEGVAYGPYRPESFREKECAEVACLIQHEPKQRPIHFSKNG